ncbi:MAG: lipid-A-disaccharide synthase [Planctomycetota bacterium]|jgi:lipid-A-disaccharide synthase
MTGRPRIYVSAGEPSGDLHGALLVRALKARLPDASFFGLGGPAMEAEGVRCLAGVDRLAFMGFTEVVKHLPFLWFLKRRILAAMDVSPTDLAVFIDYPGYNLNIAHAAKARSIPVLYYISPQIWAWNEKRKHKIVARVDRMALILPFETSCYEGTGLRVDFVGHPSVEETEVTLDREAFLRKYGLDPEKPLLALFPGSRPMELHHILPLFLRTCALLAAEVAGFQAALSHVGGPVPSALEARVAACPGVRIVSEDRYNLASHADAMLAKSGTSNVEAAILGTPLVVAYRGPRLSAFLAQRFHRLPFISLVNIVAGRAVVPEFVQGRAKPRDLADAVKPLLDRENPRRAAMIEGLKEVRDRLGSGKPSEKVADIAQQMLASADFKEEVGR